MADDGAGRDGAGRDDAGRRVAALATHAAAIHVVEQLARALQAPFARQRPEVPALETMIRREIDFYTWFMFQAV